MLLPKIKEREYRFALALRIGLPIFALILALISHTLISSYESLETSFYIESILLLVISIYFILYLIYNGSNVKIRDDVSGAFSREYLQSYLEKEIKNNEEYTLILLSVDNLHDINKIYGIKNGDKVLEKIVLWIGDYFKSEKISNFPIGHFKGGDFILGLKGKKEQYNTLLELLCLKSGELKIDDIEVKISGTITDTEYSNNLNYMIENLFELQKVKLVSKEIMLDPNELESYVIQAISQRSLDINFQAVFSQNAKVFSECFVKLKVSDKQYLYPQKYMKVVKKLGLWIEYDLMVIEKVISQIHIDETFALNISPSSIRNQKFLSALDSILQEHTSAAQHLIFILSEQEYYSFTSRYNSILNSLKSLGIKIVIDRVGSLHTSFLYLRELDIDMIRFDTYYSSENKIEENASIIEGFNIMAQEKNIKTWIKNIQTQEAQVLAEELGIDFVQGKFLAQVEKL